MKFTYLLATRDWLQFIYWPPEKNCSSPTGHQGKVAVHVFAAIEILHFTYSPPEKYCSSPTRHERNIAVHQRKMIRNPLNENCLCAIRFPCCDHSWILSVWINIDSSMMVLSWYFPFIKNIHGWPSTQPNRITYNPSTTPPSCTQPSGSVACWLGCVQFAQTAM